MLRLSHTSRAYAWGSPTAIPELLGREPTGDPQAELWFGAHPTSPSSVETGAGAVPLDRFVQDDPEGALGRDVVARFGPTLPYLLKVIAVDRPLSLQVHPHVDRAREGFAAENAAGIGLTDRARSFKDANHKPELVYALSRFEALCGFRAPRRVAETLVGLDSPLAQRLHAMLVAEPSYRGVRKAFRALLDASTRPAPEEVRTVVEACRRRLADGSPSRRADLAVVRLDAEHGGDPGVVTSLLLNPVTLEPGEALFVPAGGVHAYLGGLAVEVMANSDNVLRAGLTTKHVDIPEVLANVDYVAAPPIRIAPERVHRATAVFYAPVDDFELSVTTTRDDGGRQPLSGRGPRVLLCVEGRLDVGPVGGAPLTLVRGEAAFAPATDGPLTVRGSGTLVQADVP